MIETLTSSSELVNVEQTYRAKVLIFVPDAQTLIDAGYDSVRLERRKNPSAPWATLTKPAPIELQAGVYNYFFLDEGAQKSAEYEPVLQNSVTPGTPADVRQGVTKAVDAAFEAVCTIQELKDIYLYGLDDALSNDAGIPIPDAVYAHYIQAAIAKFEQKTSVRVLPKKFVEYQDFFLEDAGTFFFFQTDEFPVVEMTEVALTLPGGTPTAFPDEWLQLEKLSGQLHIMPAGDNPSPFIGLRNRLISSARSHKFVPRAFRLTYYAGFGPGELPPNIKDVIGKEASFGPLNIGGDLLGGAGIASQTISLDGLSTTFNTTSSATSAGFGARLIQYAKELKDQYPEIVRYFKGLRMRVL